MSFMEQQIEFGEWFVWEDKYGERHVIEYDNADLVGEEDICKVIFQRIEGYGARMSAPGYLDCTEWVVFGTEEEAQEYLDEYYGDEEDSE